ncbi:MAG: transketolase [Endomicrobiales bacterium]|nr:transketolase [Endomicrobiales bacterium]
MEVEQLKAVSKNVRKDILTMLTEAGSGHPGGSLSAVELLVELYFNQMKFNPDNTTDPGRDYFILSKGHACPVLYSVLSQLKCVDNKELCTLRKPGSRLQGHPAKDKNLPGIEVSTGSLGYGLSIGVGVALGIKSRQGANRVYVMMGDGEQQEGSIWEAAMSAGHLKLDNLCAIVDYNNLQIDGKISDVMGVEPLADKYRAFGWHTVEIDGHDFKQISKAYAEAKSTKSRPTMILARTIKGKGVSFMENNVDWHGKVPSKEQRDMALKELEK